MEKSEVIKMSEWDWKKIFEETYGRNPSEQELETCKHISRRVLAERGIISG